MSTLNDIKQNLAALGFSNTSNTAIFNEIAIAIAPTIDNTITELNNGESVILAVINSQNYGHPAWYVNIAKAFQYGYNLNVNTAINPITDFPNLNYYYPVIDTSAQIITQAAFSNNGSILYLKVATLDTISNLLVPLSNAQLAAFIAYFSVYEIPGLAVTIINNAANIFNFTTTCTYYGTYDLPSLQTAVQNAIYAFRDTFAFDGTLYITDLESYIKTNVPGVKSFYTYNQTIDNTPFSDSVGLTSGHFNYSTNVFSQITYNPI